MNELELVQQIKADLTYYGRVTLEVIRNKKGLVVDVKRINPIFVHIVKPKTKAKKRVRRS